MRSPKPPRQPHTQAEQRREQPDSRILARPCARQSMTPNEIVIATETARSAPGALVGIGIETDHSVPGALIATATGAGLLIVTRGSAASA